MAAPTRPRRLCDAVAREHPNVALISIELGDKANAWNLYVHEIAGDAEAYFFVDGDVRVRPGSLLRLRDALAVNPDANAAAALPASGRNLDSFRRDLIREHGLAGNLYALSAPFVAKIRHAGIRLPVGLVGEDSLVGALAKWNLDSEMHWNNARIVCAEAAEFAFESLSPFNPRDWHTYWRRLIRYKIRAYQNQLIRELLRRDGLAAMPRSVGDLYRRSDLQFSALARPRCADQPDGAIADAPLSLDAAIGAGGGLRIITQSNSTSR